MFKPNQKIEVVNFGVYLPIKADGTRATSGVVTELLNTGFAVRFDGYPNTVDYGKREAAFSAPPNKLESTKEREMKYTTKQLIRSQVIDYIVDYRIAMRDVAVHGQPMIDYGNRCKQQAIALFKNRHRATIGRFGQAEI